MRAEEVRWCAGHGDLHILGRRQKVGPVVLREKQGLALHEHILGSSVSLGTHPSEAHGSRWWQSRRIPKGFVPAVHLLPKCHVDSISAPAINRERSLYIICIILGLEHEC